jgi:hypothetical protein
LAGKVTKQAQVLAEIAPLLKVINIQRLTEREALEFLEKEGHSMSARTYARYKKEYETGTAKRFLELARNEWANEHLLVLDKLKLIEKKYWELFSEAETATEGKNILDSLRATQDQILLIYNETPMIQKMKESLDAKMSSLGVLKSG